MRLFYTGTTTTLRPLGNLHKPVMMNGSSPVLRQGVGKEEDVTARVLVDSEQLTPTRRKSRPAGTGAYSPLTPREEDVVSR